MAHRTARRNARLGLWAGLCAALFIPAAHAGTWSDIEALKAEIQKTGTSIVESTCSNKNLYAYYEFEKDKVDRIVICTNAVDTNDPDDYWEALAHEATHVMQACTGDYALNDKYISRAYRELQTINPTSAEDIQAYGSWNKRQEIEARWMEFQEPGFVVEMVKGNCSEGE